MLNLLALLVWAGRRVGVIPPSPQTTAFTGTVRTSPVFTGTVRSESVFTGVVTTYPA